MNNLILEQLSEKVHDAWWKEKKNQGFHAPLDCSYLHTHLKNRPIYSTSEEIRRWEKLTIHCDKCHTDMYPYDELSEHIKEYDRVTVRTVINALNELVNE